MLCSTDIGIVFLLFITRTISLWSWSVRERQTILNTESTLFRFIRSDLNDVIRTYRLFCLFCRQCKGRLKVLNLVRTHVKLVRVIEAPDEQVGNSAQPTASLCANLFSVVCSYLFSPSLFRPSFRFDFLFIVKMTWVSFIACSYILLYWTLLKCPTSLLILIAVSLLVLLYVSRYDPPQHNSSISIISSLPTLSVFPFNDFPPCNMSVLWKHFFL